LQHDAPSYRARRGLPTENLVPVEDTLTKLKHLEAMGSCGACGNSTWEPQGRHAWLLSQEVGVVPQTAGPDLTEGFPCVALLCKHCGNVRLHATELVKQR
jgi:hypothetical protein